jgi:hypothetical protein
MRWFGMTGDYRTLSISIFWIQSVYFKVSKIETVDDVNGRERKK